MNLLTLNCHSWQEENQLEKIKHIANVINNKDYDVIALQEVSQLIKSDIAFENIKKDNFALLLNEELIKLGNNKYEIFWDHVHTGYDIYDEGLCILTKLPIKEKESFYISKSKEKNFWKSRKVLKTKVEYKDNDISFYSCHLGWWNDKEEPFEYQANNLLKFIENEELVFVMGDFNNNAFIRNEGYDYLLKNGLIDTYNLAKSKDSGITAKGKFAGWDKNKEDLRLDIIFSNKEVEINSSKVIFNGDNEVVVSDHFGVEVQVNI